MDKATLFENFKAVRSRHEARDEVGDIGRGGGGGGGEEGREAARADSATAGSARWKDRG